MDDKPNDSLTPQVRPKRNIVRRSRKKGLPPGTLEFVGTIRQQHVRIELTQVTQTEAFHQIVESVDKIPSLLKPDCTAWLDVDGVHDKTVIQKIGEIFGLHPLLLEDVMDTNQRPKFEVYQNCIFVTANMLQHRANVSGPFHSEQTSFVLTANTVITFQESEGDVFNDVRKRIQTSPTLARRWTPDYLLYALMDAMVDHYFILLENFGTSIEEVEETLIARRQGEVLSEIYDLRRKVLSIRKYAVPLREMLAQLLREKPARIFQENIIYWTDLHDHVAQVCETVDGYRDLTSTLMDLSFSMTTGRTNQIMKVFTIFTAVFIPLNFLVGVYGMNFKYMPELEWQFGYPAIWGVIILTAFSLMAYFRKQRWL